MRETLPLLSRPLSTVMPRDKSQAPTSTRTMWKGAISFGLLHVPVGLYSATVSSGIDFDLSLIHI